MIGPLFIALIMGAVVYGGWLWAAQGVQHVAAEGARAAMGGLTLAEQTQLATQAARGAGTVSGLKADKMSVAVSATGQAVEVTVTYDVRADAYMALAGLTPRPPNTITRRSVVRVGGY